MRLPPVPPTSSLDELPLWPPLLATRGPGAPSAPHSHHAMHLVLALDGELRVKSAVGGWRDASGVLTTPDTPHAIDGRGAEVLLVFLEPESDVGASLRKVISGGVRVLTQSECAQLGATADPQAIMREGGVSWTKNAVDVLGAPAVAATRAVHPRVRALLRHFRDMPSDGDHSLAALANEVGLSEGRLMHAFTDSIGIPLRKYVLWLKLQRAASAIVSRVPLSDAAHSAGFADAAHMSRAFRSAFGVSPSNLRPPKS